MVKVMSGLVSSSVPHSEFNMYQRFLDTIERFTPTYKAVLKNIGKVCSAKVSFVSAGFDVGVHATSSDRRGLQQICDGDS